MARLLSTLENPSASVIPAPRKRMKTEPPMILMIRMRIKILARKMTEMTEMRKLSRMSSILSMKNRKMFSMLWLEKSWPGMAFSTTKKKEVVKT